MTYLNSVVIILGTFVIVISTTFSVLIRQRSNKLYLRFFFINPFLALLISINTILNRYFFLLKKETFIIQYLFLIFDLVFWAFFFQIIARNHQEKIFHKIVLAVSGLLIVVLFLSSDLTRSNLHIVSLFSLCKTIFCISFFHGLFSDIPYKNIKSEPLFWICCGLLFYSALSIPFYSLRDFIYLNFPLLAQDIFAISNVLIIIMHLFFIKAYLCIIRQRRV